MNERIRELAEQAFVITTDGKIGNVNNYMVEKFAKLIVREAAELVKSTQITKDGHTWRSADYVVLEHFGFDK